MPFAALCDVWTHADRWPLLSHAGRPGVTGVQAILQAEGYAVDAPSDQMLLLPHAFSCSPAFAFTSFAFSYRCLATASSHVDRVLGAGADISPWHDIPLQAKDGTYNFVCEIPKETSAKMEVATVCTLLGSYKTIGIAVSLLPSKDSA